MMNRTPLTTIAPDIFRKRLIVEGFYAREVTETVLRDYFEHLTRELGLRTYGEPIVHRRAVRERRATRASTRSSP